MARIVVTGGEGFIGRHLSAALVARGDEVVVMGRPGSAHPPVPGAGVLRIDLSDRAALDAFFASRPVEVIYHLAARTRPRPATDLSDWTQSVTNDLAPLVNLIASAASARHPPRAVIRAGTIAEYGDAPVPYREDGPTLPTTAYGTAHLAGTAYLRAMRPKLPFPVTTARLALVYGPGQSTDFLAARLMADLPRGRRVTINRPEDRRTLIHVEDVVRALLVLADNPIPLVNISTEDAPTMRGLARLIAELTGSDPSLLEFAAMPGPPTILQSDARLARSALGWTAQYGLRAGIADCLARSGTTPRVLAPEEATP